MGADATLTWNEVDDSRVTGVNIYMALTPEEAISSDPIGNTPVPDTSFEITGMVAGEKHYITARSYDIDGNVSVASVVVEYTPPEDIIIIEEPVDENLPPVTVVEIKTTVKFIRVPAN